MAFDGYNRFPTIYDDKSSSADAYHTQITTDFTRQMFNPVGDIGRTANFFAEKIISELGRLQDGWAGPDSVVPNRQAIRDAEKLLCSLPRNLKPPIVEVDEDSGEITFRWIPKSINQSIAFHIPGNSEVVCVQISFSENSSGTVKKFNSNKIFEQIERFLTNEESALTALTHS